ncbi:cation:proton antiporter domain-containing protein [Sphingomicrobium lutaoense]|uniref:CPA2 family monovalent cation:H+ antiporter-2 n=1 Tax=Sphingomicrobium lutaoense TaxID=515949 RepID=A0A839Z252_9SPHN|nr:cation:proton antiporter [Sphingomicrobium lutaoense]MBB3763823.1 CPA2 family monovalent cation:H+ antiporter-2 [Sphingomicrobium lutaoense]
MASEFDTSSLGDALVILGAAGIVIPTFARFKINPVIGFILVGIIAGPFGLGQLAVNRELRWLEHFTIQDTEAITPFADFGVILLLFAIGLELSIKRLVAMRRMVFGIGAAEMLGTAAIIGMVLIAFDWPMRSAAALSLALAMSSTAIVLPISGTKSAVGRAALAMLLFEDVALVPMLFIFGSVGGADVAGLTNVMLLGIGVIVVMMVVGRIALPPLFAQAARTKNPEVFLAISLLVVILAASATSAVGLSPILGALVAGLLIAETEYHSEVEVITAPFRGLGLGVFLITVGMRINVVEVLQNWPLLLGGLFGVLIVKAIVTGILLRLAGARRGVAAETGVLMASPSETTLIVLGAAGTAGVLASDTVAFWSAVTALGLSITPFLASLGRLAARRVEKEAATESLEDPAKGRTVIFGFGRVGRMVADMMSEHDRPYLAVDSDIDTCARLRAEGYDILYGDVARAELVDRLGLDKAAALVLTMDDPVLTARLARRVRSQHPDLPIIARARDSVHAAKLYKAGVTDAVPETLESSLQLSEAVLVDIGLAMGPVIASIHEKRSELRAQIMKEGELTHEPSLGKRKPG